MIISGKEIEEEESSDEDFESLSFKDSSITFIFLELLIFSSLEFKI